MRHRLAATLLFTILVTLGVRDARGQRREVFDARSEYRPSAVPSAHQAVVRREILPEARRLWARVENCRDEFRPLDIAAGSFTAPGAPQRAVLYRFCETGHDFARGGVAILQAGRVVAHVTLDDAQPDGLRALPDVDRDGVSELMLVDNAMHQGQATTLVSIVQLVPGGVRSFGVTGVLNDDTGTGRRGARAAASVLYVTPARRPVWEEEIYYSGETRDRYRDITALHRITLARQYITYRRLR